MVFYQNYMALKLLVEKVRNTNFLMKLRWKPTKQEFKVVFLTAVFLRFQFNKSLKN